MVDAISTAITGLNNASQRVNESARNIVRAGTNLDPVDSINISQEAINLQIAETEFKANAAVIRTENELSDELLSILDDND